MGWFEVLGPFKPPKKKKISVGFVTPLYSVFCIVRHFGREKNSRQGRFNKETIRVMIIIK